MIIAKFLPFLMVLTVFAADRFTKVIVRNHMFYGESHQILPFFRLTYIENTGAAFGMGQNQNTFFIITSIVILVVLFVMARRFPPGNPKMKSAVALIIGGALGNLYDRIAQGSVTDFLDFHAFGLHWPAFNVADSCIFIGAVFLALSQWKSKETQPV